MKLLNSIKTYQSEKIILYKYIICSVFILSALQFQYSLHAQTIDSNKTSFFTPAQELNKERIYSAGVFVGITYSAFAIGLNKAWYSSFPRTKFHFFNDFGEWQQMDKYAHIYNTYFQCELGYQGARWTGMNKKSSIITGIGMGLLFQSTIEILDGFSTQWGFSNWDMGFNLIGAATFFTQQYYWNEQRIRIKLSAFPFEYSNDIINSGPNQISLSERAADLYGTSLPSRILKDYNAINIWASMNIHDLMGPIKSVPSWLNVAVGIGANNLYGGFENKWNKNGMSYEVPNDLYPRYNQYFLGLDVDWTKIKTDHAFLKTLFKMINIFKFPSPTIELNSRGNWKWHWLYF